MSPGELVTTFATLFVIIDPIGLAPLFVALTRGMDPAERRGVARRAVGIGFALMAAFGVAGEALLGAIGISMAAFRVSGGLLMFLIAVEMLFERRSERREKRTAVTAAATAAEHSDPSVFPLATPLIAGPGALATMILLSSQHTGDLGALVMLNLVLAAVLGLTWLLLRGAGLVERALGHTGVVVVTRLLGILLAALSVQFVFDGLRQAGLVGG